MNIDNSNNRDEWKVSYLGKALADAASIKETHHNNRVKWWQDKYKEVEEKIREKGVTIHESQAASYSSSGMEPQILYDVGLTKDLKEANQKIKDHGAREREYNGWRQMMDANSNKEFELTINDWLYFFGK